MLHHLKTLAAFFCLPFILLVADVPYTPDVRAEPSSLRAPTFTEPRIIFGIEPVLDGFSRNVSPRITTDGGANWMVVWTLYPDAVRWHRFYGYHPITLHSRSTDGGVTWSYGTIIKPDALMDFLNDINARIAIDGEGNWLSTLSYGDTGYERIGVYRSTDVGRTWSISADYVPPAGYEDGDETHLEITASTEGRFLLSAGYSHSAQSDVGGQNWGGLAASFDTGAMGPCTPGSPISLTGDQSMGLWAGDNNGWEAVYRTKIDGTTNLVSYRIIPSVVDWEVTASQDIGGGPVSSIAPVASFIGGQFGFIIPTIPGLSSEMQGGFRYATRGAPCDILQTPLTIFSEPGDVTQLQTVVVGEPGLGVIVYIFFKQEGSDPTAIRVMVTDGTNYSEPQIAVDTSEYELGEFDAQIDATGRIFLSYSLSEIVSFDNETNAIEHIGLSIGSESGNPFDSSQLRYR